MIERKDILSYNDIGHDQGFQIEKEVDKEYKLKPYRFEVKKSYQGNTLVLRNECSNKSSSDRE